MSVLADASNFELIRSYKNMKENKVLLSKLWVFVTFNYLYCDLISLMDSNLLKQYLTGRVEGLVMDEAFLLYAGMLMELPIAMVLLSGLLKDRVNAWFNAVAGSIKTVVMIMTLFIGNATKYYMFFALIEISTTAYIIFISMKWIRSMRASKIVV
jgi:hypothetical protein